MLAYLIYPKAASKGYPIIALTIENKDPVKTMITNLDNISSFLSKRSNSSSSLKYRIGISSNIEIIETISNVFFKKECN